MLEKKYRKKIIISADDFGKSELANKNILKLAQSGKLDRVSVISDGNFGKEELKTLANTGVKLDVHLILRNRLEDRKRIKEGFFRRCLIFFENYLFGLLGGKKRIEKDWDGQIRQFINIVGKTPDGINSHRYDHFFPVYFPVALKLAKKHGIERIRFGKILAAGKNRLVSGILRSFWGRDRKKFINSWLESYDYCVNLDWIKEPQKFFESLPDGKIELVAHPEREEEYNFINNLTK